jgi:hypothetical protein
MGEKLAGPDGLYDAFSKHMCWRCVPRAALEGFDAK